MRVLDLFSGIGGFSLGLERAGFETVAFCEIEPFCRKVLRKHWPDVPIYEDIRELTGEKLRQDGISADVVTGGFPCQDLSVAGRQAGIGGERSGLWSELHRIIGEVRPRYAIVENVANLLSGPSEQRGGWFGRILGDLAECGYDAEWENIPASAVGAPHRRERIWIIAYPRGAGLEGHQSFWESVCGVERKTSTKFGDRIVSGGPDWPELSTYLRMGNGLPREVDEIKGLGNAVVPQIPELIGRAILEAEMT